MDWVSNSWWIFLALAICVIILAAVFSGGRRSGEADSAGCCSGMENGKAQGKTPTPHGHH